METIDNHLQHAKQEIDHLSKTSPTEAGQAKPNSGISREALVDALNQIFSLFRVNYHNQFYAAFNDSETLNQAKRMWLNASSHYDPENLLRGAKVIIESSEYLPTLNQFLRQCDKLQFQLPTDLDAYREACNAADQLSSHQWSHPAVYHAGKKTGWHALRSLPEKQIFPAFKEQFEKQKVLLREGKVLKAPELPMLSKSEAHPLPTEEKKKRLAKIKDELGFTDSSS